MGGKGSRNDGRMGCRELRRVRRREVSGVVCRVRRRMVGRVRCRVRRWVVSRIR